MIDMLRVRSRMIFLILTTFVMVGFADAKEKRFQQPLKVDSSLSDEEAFLVRRIAEFWKDGDFDIVKDQIKDFLVRYPHSNSGDLLKGILGDLYLQEKEYRSALERYDEVSEPGVKEKIHLNKLQCYYELHNFAQITSEALPYMHTQPESFEERIDEFHFLVAEGFFHQVFETNDPVLKEEFLLLAEPHYEKLQGSVYADSSLFSLAEINRLLGRAQKAAGIYANLAKKYPSDQEELQFQVASMEALFDKHKAIESFGELAKTSNTRGVEAAFNQMVIYFQLDEFSRALDLHEDMLSALPETQKPLYHYIVGKSHFSLSDYHSAARSMQTFLEYQTEDTPLHKNSLLILMTSAAQTDNEALFDQTLTQFKSAYPYDDELPKALFMHALICKEQGNFSKMGERLEYLVVNHPQFEDRESLLFEYGIYCHDMERWKDCYNTFTSYLGEYNDSPRNVSARKFFISSSLHLLKAGSEDSPEAYSVKQLTKDLEMALEGENLFSSKERAQYRLLYAKALFSISNFEKSLEMIDSLEDFANEANFLAEVYYLRSEANHQLNKNPMAFYEPMEKAIELNPDLGENSAVHLQLYNSYISHVKILMNEPSSDELVEALYDKAAKHLYTAFSHESSHIKLENRLWLANYYYTKAKDLELFNSSGSNFLTAMELYEKILMEPNAKNLAEITPESLFIEQEALKYAELLGYANQAEEKVRVLRHLAQAQNAHPDWGWHRKNEALLELARSYEALSDLENALETYSFLQKTNDSGYSALATYHASKIRFDLLDQEERLETNNEVRIILNELKELQIRKNPLSEPLHLEAGLEYASIRSRIADEEKQADRYIFFLGRLREDFESPADPLAIEYKNKLSNTPEKKQLYDAYMKYIDAELLRTQAKVKFKEKGSLEAEELNTQALALFSELQTQQITDPYLQKRVKESIHEIQALDTYN